MSLYQVSCMYCMYVCTCMYVCVLLSFNFHVIWSDLIITSLIIIIIVFNIMHHSCMTVYAIVPLSNLNYFPIQPRGVGEWGMPLIGA